MLVLVLALVLPAAGGLLCWLGRAWDTVLCEGLQAVGHWQTAATVPALLCLLCLKIELTLLRLLLQADLATRLCACMTSLPGRPVALLPAPPSQAAGALWGPAPAVNGFVVYARC